MAKILLVDDDLDIRELGRAILSHAGHNVQLSDNAINAFHFLRHNRVDLLITDANMPNVTGFDLIRMLKVENGFDRLPIVMLTGLREKKDVAAAVGLGVQAYIVKPIDPVVFIEKINAVLEKNPPDEQSEYEYFSARVSAKGRVSALIEIRAVSELGLTIRSQHQFHAGASVRIESEIFQEIGIAPPRLRVFICEKVDGLFETRLSFAALDEFTLVRLKTWVASQTKTAQQTPTKTRKAS